MKNKLYWLLIVFITVSMLGAQPSTVLADEGERVPPHQVDAPYRPGEVIVVLNRAYSNRAQLNSIGKMIASPFSGRILDIRKNAFLMKVDEGTDIPAFAKSFKENVGNLLPNFNNVIKYAEPNYIYDVPEPPPPPPGGGSYTPPVTRPNGRHDKSNENELKQLKSSAILPTYPEDPLLYNTWGWWNTEADVVWQEKSASPMVCLLDTGVDGAHPDLAGVVTNGKDVVNNDAVPDDDNGHGTMMAGIIAAKANNKIGIAGISNAKILAVKVMNSEGMGDSWDIAYGIYFCADNSSVKVLSMSFGSYAASEYIYDALEYAILIKGKLGVAAAGNASTFIPKFPAAWGGDFICSDGSYYLNPSTKCRSPYVNDPAPNRIAPGLISVGASRSYWGTAYDTNGDGYLWVDVNGDHVQNVTDPNNAAFWNEHFDMWQCAASFSNIGAWVNIVAPGENVLSTVPVSYPFHEGQWGADPDGDGYDYWNGTSLSVPFVTGAAARVWSIGSKLFGSAAFTYTDVKNQLISNGYSLATAMDPNIASLDTHGEIIDGYYGTYSGEAPYCWPNASKGALNSMSNTRMLSLADAMDRTSVYAYLYNATNGLPLRGATIGAYAGSTVASAGFLNSNTSSVVVLPNLPRGKTYDIKVNKTGFTSGVQPVAQLYVSTDFSYISSASVSVSIPPMGKIDGVIDWVVYSPASELDFYVWTPTQSNPSHGGIIGYSLDTPSYIGEGRLIDWPFARWNHDSYSLQDWSSTESITIMPKSGSIPYYNLTQYDYYDFIVHDFDPGALNDNEIYFRLWNAGKVKATVYKTASCDTDGQNNILGDSDDERWWEPGFMQFGNFITWNVCGQGVPYNGNGGLWPYSILSGTELPIRPLR